MSEVKRYDIEADTPYAVIHHYDRVDGDWVKHEDYAALQQKIEAALAERDQATLTHDYQQDQINFWQEKAKEALMVVLPEADHETDDGYKYYREETVIKTIRAAGGSVKE